MTQHEMEAKYLELMNNPAFAEELLTTTSMEDTHKQFTRNGLDISLEETAEIVTALVAVSDRSTENNGEISEDNLESVVGGINLIKVAYNTWNWGTKIAGLYWGSQTNAKKATISFWTNVVTKGWDYASRNVGNF